MKRLAFFIIFLIIFGCTGQLFAQEQPTHHAYRVTSYNLGPILDFHEKHSLFNSADFGALMITSTASDILNSELQPSVSWIETAAHTSPNRGVALSAQFDATNKISLHGAFGLTKHLWAPDRVEYENESSWEANLGFVYKLVDNLSYELHFGYMDTGNLFTDQSSYSDVENIIMVSNQISMSF